MLWHSQRKDHLIRVRCDMADELHGLALVANGPDAPRGDVKQPEDLVECRICYGGLEVGPMIRPCRCNGTQRLIHMACLDQWRFQRAANLARCPTCHYEYRFARVRWAQWIEHPRTVLALTLGIIVLSVCFVAYFLKYAALLLSVCVWHLAPCLP
jgi:E3 ubiquitin-protein ligase DOA10